MEQKIEAFLRTKKEIRMAKEASMSRDMGMSKQMNMSNGLLGRVFSQHTTACNRSDGCAHRQGRYPYANKEFNRALRITEDQIKGKTDDELFSTKQATAFQANDRKVFEARVPMEFEELALQEDGLHTSIVQKFPLETIPMK
jgi:hypothetical protein